MFIKKCKKSKLKKAEAGKITVSDSQSSKFQKFYENEGNEIPMIFSVNLMIGAQIISKLSKLHILPVGGATCHFRYCAPY